ncbi:MAG: ATP phosphoribosyltransferase regulatory subunit [Blastocatellia bacterium]|nr:ATP phosphoribosyltransferase regulatory subunit [Blastocatellia bacterium]
MNSPTLLSKIPPGVTYVLGEEVIARRAVERTVFEVLHGWSYAEILLPAFDYHEIFAQGLGTRYADTTFCFTDSEGGLLALRPDLTALVARTVATRFGGQPRPIRLCYTGEVFRNLQTPGRAPRESWQIGAELIGNDRLEADAEMLFVAIESMQRLGAGAFQITLGHAGFFQNTVTALNLNSAETQTLFEILDSRNQQRLLAWLQDRTNPQQAESWTRLFQLAGGAEVLEAARNLGLEADFSAAIDDLEHVWEIARVLQLDHFLELDLGEVSNLDYYTGMTFKIYAAGVGASVGSGGRYDRLLRNFGADEPAVGFQFNLERMICLLRQQKNSPSTALAPTILEADSDNLLAAFQNAQQLRNQGKQVEIKTMRHSLAPH